MLRSTVLWLGIFVPIGLQAANLVVEGHGGDLYVRDSLKERLYKDIFGKKDGLDRVLISINGQAAIFVLGRDSYYYTLKVDGSLASIDCAYADGRNNYNGARVLVGECDLDLPLKSSFYEVGMEILDKQRREVYSFDTKAVAQGGGRYLIGEMNGVEFFDEYHSEEALINSRPEKLARWKGRCHRFDADLVFLTRVEGGVKYVDLVKSLEPMVIERLNDKEVRFLAVQECW